MKRCGSRNALLLAAGLIGLGGLLSTALAQSDDGIVLVVLKPRVQTGGALVRLGDVADVQGGDPKVRDKLLRLDLAEAGLEKKDTLISREQVSYRLALSGLDGASVRVSGASKTVVLWDSSVLTEENLVATARAAIQQRLPKNADDVAIRLVRPPQVPQLAVQRQQQVRLQAEVAGPNLSGRVKVEVSVLVNGVARSVAPVFFDVAYAQLEPEQEPILIKARDAVRLVAHIGSARVTALGEALQDGKAGQLIRIRNVDSGKTISGRVVDRNIVEVGY